RESEESVAGPKYRTRLKRRHTSTQASARAPPRQICIRQQVRQCTNDAVECVPGAPTRPVTSLNVFKVWRFERSLPPCHSERSLSPCHSERSEESRSGRLEKRNQARSLRCAQGRLFAGAQDDRLPTGNYF